MTNTPKPQGNRLDEFKRLLGLVGMQLPKTSDKLQKLHEALITEGTTSAQFTCLCGKQAGWITDGEEHPNPCPYCGRRYRGEYNPKKLTIEAVEIDRLTKGKEATVPAKDVLILVKYHSTGGKYKPFQNKATEIADQLDLDGYTELAEYIYTQYDIINN